MRKAKVPLVFAICLAVAAVSFALRIGRKVEWIGNKKAAYILLSPKEVTDGIVQGHSFSPDGEHFIVASAVPKTEALNVLDFLKKDDFRSTLQTYQIQLWNRKTDSVSVPWSAKMVGFEGSNIAWFGKSSIALMECTWQDAERDESRYGLVRIDCERNTVQAVPGFDNLSDYGRFVMYGSDSSGALYILQEKDSANGFYRVTSTAVASITQDQFRLAINEIEKEDKRHIATSGLQNKPQTLKETLSFNSGSIHLQLRKTAANKQAAWLVLPEPSRKSELFMGLVDDRPEISATRNSLAYQSSGRTWVRRILQVSGKELAAFFDVQRKEAISRAKQVGTAISIYMNDADDQLPLTSNFNEGILPYTKDSDMTEGFNYNPQGNPSDDPHVVVGEMNGPDGVAIVYGDGHVTWVPDP